VLQNTPDARENVVSRREIVSTMEGRRDSES
jgi:hypothetical protein